MIGRLRLNGDARIGRSSVPDNGQWPVLTLLSTNSARRGGPAGRGTDVGTAQPGGRRGHVPTRPSALCGIDASHSVGHIAASLVSSCRDFLMVI